MKGRPAAFVLGAFLGALGTQDLPAGDNDRAVPRGGGGGGGSSSGGSHGGGGGSAAARHPSSSGGSGSSNSGGGSSYSGSSSSASRGPQTGAQRRQPVPGQGHSGHGHSGGYYGHGYGYYGGYYPYYPYYSWPYWGWGYAGFYSPWYYPYSGFYAGFGYPYYGGGGYFGFSYSGGGGGGYASGGGGYSEGPGSVRLIVEPVQAKVYVDGYYTGKVDDFDGMFQRLNLRPGAHDIELKLDGYETHRIKVYVRADHTIKVRYDMVRGDPSRVSEQTVGDPADAERYARRAEREREPEYEPESEDREPQTRIEEGERRSGESWSPGRERGTLRLEVSPADASIYVDGMFRGTGQDLRRLNLPPGRHRLEVVRPGYRTLERDVEVHAGETEQIELELPRS